MSGSVMAYPTLSLYIIITLPDITLSCMSIIESDNESDDEFHERLDRALRDGYVEIFTAKCGVSGPPGQITTIDDMKGQWCSIECSLIAINVDI